ncbi:MAG: (d)CMP kinase, partial [Gemmatimonadetes bacterium]|nr:(d)CMP kinase [Gemmatimonadota bacterium]NIP78281.1 (d)CMP kinase [Gemmatimonadota bacterium]NIR78550.1 (d)CMP kinase [Gemmatimonadota bacterium]NIU31004.1 (d)CMP kinase [Gemmatimonadota bacterium]NIU35758.1 (d)CMP kinase [Gemmatimonadota bacterium]
TIDGPAGSGKSTTAREVARKLGLRHLDSGALYRAVTFALLEAGLPPERWDDLSLEALQELPIELRPTGSGFDVAYRDRVLGAELRSPRVTEAASRAARIPAVRERLYGLQRAAGRAGGLVADGRDVGTVVFPHADVKVFLTADLQERARRRLLEREERDPTPDEIREEADRLRDRDRRDTDRAHSPLRRPEDALTVDTTDLSFEEQVDRIVQRVRALTAP